MGRNVSKSNLSGMRRDRPEYEKIVNIQKAWLKGQNPWITIDNPNKNDPSALKIKVRANDLMGHPKSRVKEMFIMK